MTGSDTKPEALDNAALDAVVDALVFDDRGLIPVIAQQHDTGEVLMLAWMNAGAVRATLAEGRVVYWSRSRAGLWRKGETSGHVQRLVAFRYDCDADAVLVLVDQTGPACHTNRRNCFYHEVAGNGAVRVISQPIA